MAVFSEIVDAADSLSIDEQITLLEILRRRIAERSRGQLASDVQEARGEFTSGTTGPKSVQEIMDEANGET